MYRAEFNKDKEKTTSGNIPLCKLKPYQTPLQTLGKKTIRKWHTVPPETRISLFFHTTFAEKQGF
jgi:hypothetical protein